MPPPCARPRASRASWVDSLLVGRVYRGAHPVKQLGDLDRRVSLGSLEQEVLEEVRDTGLLRGLVARTHPDPQPQSDRANRGTASVITRSPP